MINILKMDYQRFKSNKVMYILLLLFIGFQIFGVFMMKQYEEPIEHGGISVSTMNESQFLQLMLSQPPSWLLLYITVFTVYFYMSEYQSGFYKNYLSLKNARIYSVISKIMIIGAFTLLMFVAMIISDLIGRSLFFHHAAIGDLSYFVNLLIGQFLLHWAFAIMILCITIIAKNVITSIIIGVVLGFNVLGMVVSAIEAITFNSNLSSYMLVNTITIQKDFDDIGDIRHVVSVAIIFILLFSFISVRYKSKEDLK